MAIMGEPINMNSRKRHYSEVDSDSSANSFDLHDSDFDVAQLITIKQQQQHQQQPPPLSHRAKLQVKNEPDQDIHQQQQHSQDQQQNFLSQRFQPQNQQQQQQQLSQSSIDSYDLQSKQCNQQQQPQQQIQQQQQQQQQQQLHQQQQPQQQQQQSDNKPKRNPYCSRCRNHGKSAQVKGHKRHCEYRDCKCVGCRLVECRQIVSAAQIKRRRYQKQDEECGRSIEITPPVLTREPADDPAALMAKTLIGSASMEHQLQQQHHQQQHALQQTASQHQHHQLQQQQQVAQLSMTTTKQLPAMVNHHSHQMLPHLPNIHVSSAASSALSSALHLFHLPNSVLASAAAAANVANLPAAATTAAGSPTLPSNREQVSLVDEVFRSFGPLAIYAWLLKENFDIQKVRRLIELARLPFSELLQNDHADHALDLTSPIDIVD